MSSDPIATATFVVVMLVMMAVPIVIGGLLLSRGRGKRRQAQIDYLTWVAQQPVAEYSQPFLDGPPGVAAPTHGAPQSTWPMSAMPPDVRAGGRGLRVWGWILLGFGCLVVLSRLAAAGA